MKKFFLLGLVVVMASASVVLSGCAATIRSADGSTTTYQMGVVSVMEADYIPAPIFYDHIVWNGTYFTYYHNGAAVFRDYQPQFGPYYRSGWTYYNHNHPNYHRLNLGGLNQRFNATHRIRPTRPPVIRHR